ncbi:MAG TPA: cytochrome c [Chryseosolibacter sp.]
MNTKFSLSIILTIGAFVLTLYFFGVAILAKDEIGEMSVSEPLPGCGTMDYLPQAREAAIDHPGKTIFDTNCKACHRIDQKLVGPALAGAMERYDSVWLVSWIRNSAKMIADGDPQAVALFNEYNRIQMTSFTSLTDEDLKNLFEYIRLSTEPRSVTPSLRAGI